MQISVRNIPEYVILALETLRSNNFEAYLVGGCVRDILLGTVPHDWDITTNAKPEQIISAFTGFSVIPTGIKHGTVTVLIDHIPVEITTYRVDGAYSDNRRPDKVAFTSNLREDLSRRDFTINSLAMDPNGTVIDHFGGVPDIQGKTVRAVGDAEKRFEEDALRILRALRFAAVLAFSIEPETSKAIHAQKHLLHNISAERIQAELTKLICGASATVVVYEYADVIREIIPEFEPVALETVPASPVLRWAMCLRGMGKAADTVMRALKFDNSTRAQTLRLINNQTALISAAKPEIKRWLNKWGSGAFFDLLLFMRAAESVNDTEEIERIAREIIRDNECFTLKDLAVSGSDLVKLGFSGTLVGKTLDKLLDAVIDERTANEKTALLDLALRV